MKTILAQRRLMAQTIQRLAGAFICAVCWVAWLPFFLPANEIAAASTHYTEKQLEALAERVGKTFWFNPAQRKTAVFLTAPASNAQAYQPSAVEGFEITELAGQKAKDPYYKVKFDSGKIAYIRPERFHEELNVTILTVDPLAEQRERDEQAAAEEKKRVEWIKAQPWSPAVKEASIRKQPTLGLTSGEIKKVLGAPSRINKTRVAGRVANEERWFYTDGTVLTFQNGLLTRVEKRDK